MGLVRVGPPWCHPAGPRGHGPRTSGVLAQGHVRGGTTIGKKTANEVAAERKKPENDAS